MTQKVSVIVPVYKIETYLKKCIKSILRQTYPNIEIILVDDGSPDDCPAICDSFAAKYPQIKAIHCKNGGVSNARNIGINAATGAYIMFIDGDDWLPQKAVEELVCGIEQNNCDFCYGAIKEILVVGNRYMPQNAFDRIHKTDAAFFSYMKQITKGPWAKIFKRELLVQHNIRFIPGIRYGEDAIFIYQYLQIAKTMCAINNIVYCYNRIVPTAATRKYYPKIHEWELRIITELEALYTPLRGNQAVETAIAKKTILSFLNVCRQHCQNNSADIATKRLQETYNVYTTHMDTLNKIDVYMKNPFFQPSLTLYKEIKSGNYIKSYHKLSNQSLTQKETAFKKTTRDLIIRIKTFFIFKFLI